jgi:Tfp pilus assembly major pilin PilA
MFLNKKGITIIKIIIWVVIIGSIIIYAPKIYNYYVEKNTERMIKSNMASVEDEIKSQLIDKHPVLIWNDMDNLIKSLSFQNPITKKAQIKNEYKFPGAVSVIFDGVNTFTIDGVGLNGEYLNINIAITR